MYKIIIEDYQKTVKRLQDECKEKSDFMFKLIDKIIDLQTKYNMLLKENQDLKNELNKKPKFYGDISSNNSKWIERLNRNGYWSKFRKGK